MDDNAILQLYWNRDDGAVAATAQKYGAYCTAIAQRILTIREDAEECVNDTYWHAWQAIPPRRPNPLRAFLGAVTRNLAFDRWQKERAEKRGGGETALALEELEDCISGQEDTALSLDAQELQAAIRTFLEGLSREQRNIFLCRYWHVYSVREIAGRFGKTENGVSALLFRLRKKLRAYLIERGFDL